MIAIARAREPQGTTQPVVTYSAARLDDGIHVLIVDHPKELHVVVDDRLTATELAAALTEAVRDNMAKNRWNRTITALLAADDD